MTIYDSTLADCVRTAFNELRMWFCFYEAYGLFHAELPIEGLLQEINLLVDVTDTGLLFYAMSPFRADKTDAVMMANVAEFIARANYGIRDSCLEMDFRDGEIRSRAFWEYNGVLPTTEDIHRRINACASLFILYVPGLLGIIFSDKSAEEMIEQCES